MRVSISPASASARSCSETAPKVTSGIASAISPAASSRFQTRRRISRRRGEAIAARTAGSIDTAVSLVETKMISQALGPQPLPQAVLRLARELDCDLGIEIDLQPRRVLQRRADFVGRLRRLKPCEERFVAEDAIEI